MMDKKQLREIYKAKRQALSKDKVTLLDQQLLNQMQRYDWTKIHFLHVYLAIEKFNEFNTWPFIRWIWQQYPEITVLISKSDFKTQKLDHFVLKPDTKLLLNNWGIPEPDGEAEKVDSGHIDGVITPLLVADKFGNRVGYGKGFYDRFFAECGEDIMKLGVSYFSPIDQIDDVSEFDVPISLLFTPEQTILMNL